MNMLKELWRDTTGVVLSSELVLLGTLGVVGTTVGLHMAASAVNEELKEVAYAIRSLDQSYAYTGFSSCNAMTVGSSYTQRPVADSLKELCDIEERALDEDHRHHAHPPHHPPRHRHHHPPRKDGHKRPHLTPKKKDAPKADRAEVQPANPELPVDKSFLEADRI